MTAHDALGGLDAAIQDAAPEERPGLVVALAARLAQLGAGLSANGVAPRQPAEPEAGEQLLTPEQALVALGGDVSRKWLLRHTRRLRFRRNLSRKVVRFEEGGLRRWAAARRT